VTFISGPYNTVTVPYWSLMIVFLLRDAVLVRYMRSLCVSPYVCPSVSSTKMAKPRITPCNSPELLVF